MRGLAVIAGVAAAAIPAASSLPFSRHISFHAQSAYESYHSPSNLFGTAARQRHSSRLPQNIATHVEDVEETHESHCDELRRHLSVRGGADDNAEWNSCTDYATVGIVNLLPASSDGGHDDVGASLARRLEEELLPSSSSSFGGHTKLIALPSEGGVEPLVGSFGGSSGDESSATASLASYETIGTLCDTCFILLGPDGKDANAKVVDSIACILKGLARKTGGHSGTGSKPRLIFYVQTDADHQTHARELLRSALDNIRFNSKWDTVAELQNYIDIVVLPYTAETFSDMAATGKVFANRSQSDAPKDLPLSSFETLVGQVCRALSRGAVDFSALRAESDNDEHPAADISAGGEIYEADELTEDEESEDLLVSDDITSETNSIDDLESMDVRELNEFDNPSRLDSEMIFSQITTASRQILIECERMMGDLESKQDEFLLNSEEGMPILEFGSDAQAILEHAIGSFDDMTDDATGNADIDDAMKAQMREMKMSLLLDVAGDSGLRHLFELQLQSLREYYGRRYETVLDEILGGAAEGGEPRSKEKQEAILTAAAQRAAEGFRTAAGNAMPSSCRDGSILESLDFSIIITRDLNGLMQDMIEATQTRQELEEEWDDAATGEVEEANGREEGSGDGKDTKKIQNRRKGPAKWYEKIAARALVLGVNYLQGWLALQQLRKAAADRDKAMPKFPLF